MRIEEVVELFKDKGLNANKIHKMSGASLIACYKLLKGEPNKLHKKTRDKIIKFAKSLRDKKSTSASEVANKGIEQSKSSKASKQNKPSKQKKQSKKREEKKSAGVPFYTNINNSNGEPSYYVDCKPLNDCTAFIPFIGESMSPKINNGDLIGIKKINNLDVLQWGETYLVCTNENANSMKTVKDLFSNDDDAKVTLRAANIDYMGEIVVDKSDISEIYIVKGKISQNQL